MTEAKVKEESRLRINWGQIVTNAVSLLVGSVFLGAAYVVWDAATTMDDRIERANDGLSMSQDALAGTQQILTAEVTDLKAEVGSLTDQLDKLRGALAQTPANDSDRQADIGSLSEWAREEPSAEIKEQARSQNADRLSRELEPYQIRSPTQLQIRNQAIR
jgi:peptidoglycan hydrolase CwlO-like protein